MPTLVVSRPQHPVLSHWTASTPEVVAPGVAISPAPGDRVVFLVGYTDARGVRAQLEQALSVPDCDLLVVLPGPPPVGSQRALLGQRARAAGVATLQHAPLAESLLHTRSSVLRHGMFALCEGMGAIPWVAGQDVAALVLDWLDGTPLPAERVVGPQPLYGHQLASLVSELIAELRDPAQFVSLQMAEMADPQTGLVSIQNAVDALVALGAPEPLSRTLAHAADTDRSGTLELQELIAGAGEALRYALKDATAPLRFRALPVAYLCTDWISDGLSPAAAHALVEHLLAAHAAELGWQGRTPVEAVLRAHRLAFVPLSLIPGHGFMMRRYGSFGDPFPDTAGLLWDRDDPCLSVDATLSRLELTSGGTLTVRRTHDNAAFEARWSGGEGVSELLRYGTGEDLRVIELRDGCLTGLASRQPWPELRDMMGDLFAKRALRPWERAVFLEAGVLCMSALQDSSEPDQVICHCAGVSRGQLQVACEAGQMSVAAVARATGATLVCGGCTPVVEEILGSPRLQVAELIDVTPLSKDIIRVRIRTGADAVPPALPGQHIVLQVRLNGRWVTRAYTLTSPGGALDAYELTIKREEMGQLSRWLADYADKDALIRCSSPQGDFCLRPEERGPVVMFAGGIGVTPGIALARTLSTQSERGPLHIDWSARKSSDFVFADELDRLSGGPVSWTRRCTTQGPRLDPGTIAREYPYRAGGLAFVCGPARYMEMVCAALEDCGWPSSAVRTERFFSAVNDAGQRVEPPAVASSSAVPVLDAETPVQAESFFLDPSAAPVIAHEAEAFLSQMYREQGLQAAVKSRVEAVGDELSRTGTYTHTPAELNYGAQLAWRNSTRCIGRFFWQHLEVRDMRHLETEEELFAALVEHMRRATNGGDIRSMLTVFRPGGPDIRIWNGQLIRYAGYRQPDGTVVGDPANCDLTERIQALGWSGGGGRFDVLPLVIQIGDRPPKVFVLPEEAILEVPLEHPAYPWFAELGLRWYALPAVSEMALDLGGITYRCVPFNGFYMVTEIGARNLADADRYNMLPVVAEKLGLDCSDSSTMWKDRAMVELSVAVMHSFKKHRVRMLDHHKMSDYFHRFEQQEKACGRPVFGDWSWLVPPMSGAASSLFFRSDLRNVLLKPMFQYQAKVWEDDPPVPDHEGPVPPVGCPHHSAGG